MIVSDEGLARGSPPRGSHRQLAGGACQFRRNVSESSQARLGRRGFMPSVYSIQFFFTCNARDSGFVSLYFGLRGSRRRVKMFELIHHTTVLFSSHWPLTDINDNPKTGGKAAGAWQYGSLYLCLVRSILHGKTLRTRIAALQVTTSVGSSRVGTRRVTGGAQELTGIWPLT
jgi:hypothetical protein